MKKYTLDLQQAISLGLQEPFAYITRLSEVQVGRTPGEFSTDELLEARFFGREREIRILASEDGFQAYCLEDEDGDDCLEFIRQVRKSRNFSRFGSELTLLSYLGFDADGQAYICDTRLRNWKEA